MPFLAHSILKISWKFSTGKKNVGLYTLIVKNKMILGSKYSNYKKLCNMRNLKLTSLNTEQKKLQAYFASLRVTSQCKWKWLCSILTKFQTPKLGLHGNNMRPYKHCSKRLQNFKLIRKSLWGFNAPTANCINEKTDEESKLNTYSKFSKKKCT